MAVASTGLPCAGLSVVEVAVGCSDLGLGLAGAVPGMILGDFGATVTRVVGSATLALDEDLPWRRPWHRDKHLVRTDDVDDVLTLLGTADVAFVYGSESIVEGRGLGFRDVQSQNPTIVYGRCRPSRTSTGTVDDFGLLVEARSGFCTQLAGHRPGPIFVDARASVGVALELTVSVLALLRRRVRADVGGWAETSLYDGMLSTLGCMIGRSERAPVEVESYWEKGSTFPNFLYRCADGELIQVWFGGKGMYATLLEVLGDQPSAEGYYRDQATGALNERAVRWRTVFPGQTRDRWIEQLRDVGIPCEPVLHPGEALADPHLAEAGIAIARFEGGHHDVMVATPISVTPLSEDTPPVSAPGQPAPGPAGTAGLLEGVRVLDFSAFVAGPLAAQVLADLGAEVIKVEPLEGEAMRAAAYAMAAAQRGKRSLAMDITSSAARPVLDRLIGWADVVLHNFRVGVAERLGIDADTVARLNPDAVYCHASAFGASGPRATSPGNDALMQALTGFERAVGGVGNDPIAGTWIPIDMCGGWVAATGIVAGLYRSALTGTGQRVATSLLGAGMLLQSGVFQRDGRCGRHPELDDMQTGYGPAYRLYEAGDGEWFAMVVADRETWCRLRSHALLGALPERYAGLRGGVDDELARQAEAVFEGAFRTAPADHWVDTLRELGALAEPVEALDRDGFRRRVLDDPVNRQLGRVASFATAEWGRFEQVGPLLRCGPSADVAPMLMLPGIGEHSFDVLRDLGLAEEDIDGLTAAGVVRQLERAAS